MPQTKPPTDAFVAGLHVAASRSEKPLIRFKLFVLPATEQDAVEHHILSWKAQEFAYRQFTQDSDDLPTLARGLFTERVSKNGKEHERIVVRGYDKFFNIGELPWTSTESIAAYAKGPFVVSHKENGCIIFVAALSPTRLIVTSKHALGSRPEDEGPSHADMGYAWLKQQLAQCGRTEEALAAELWKRNETAVMELCDDSFEEHVLAYPPERSGLYLHGLNANAADFATRPMQEVTDFALSWGFFPVQYRLYDTWDEVDAFAKEVGKTGSFDGQSIEGFVVRCQMPEQVSPVEGVKIPPYHAGQTWFFKIKFDEPYLMYRSWRELTRTMLRDKAKWEEQQQLQEKNDTLDETMEGMSLNEEAPAVPETTEEGVSKKALKRAKKQAEKQHKAKLEKDRSTGRAQPLPPTPRPMRPESLVYVRWCYDLLYGDEERHIAADPELFASFSQGRGIIALREKFLAYLSSEEGQKVLAQQQRHKSANVPRDLHADDRPFSKTLIVPVAVPGCGKTALCVALSNLFHWGHTQSDDVQSKRTGPAFLKNVETELLSHDVVLADRNNHLMKHREELVDVVRRVSDPAKGKVGRVRLVALAWRLDGVPLSKIQSICASRMMDRGNRHQCLRVESRKHFAYDSILTRFIKDMEGFRNTQADPETLHASDAQFDDVVWLDIDASFEDTLARAMDRLCPMLALPQPSQTAVEASMAKALHYSPQVRKPLPKLPTGPPVDRNAVYPSSYIGVFAHMDLKGFVLQLLDHLPDTSDTVAARHVLHTIIQANRMTEKPHVTILHRHDVDTCLVDEATWTSLYAKATDHTSTQKTCSIRICGLAWNERVMALEVSEIVGLDVSFLQARSGRTPHVTVGTADPAVLAYEANQLWAENTTSKIEVSPSRDVPGVLAFHSNPK